MKDPTTLPFLARPGYRLRRLIEAIKLMPLVGLLLFLLPLLWAARAGEAGARTSMGWLYVFAVWFLLIGAAALGSWAYGRAKESVNEAEADGEDGSL